MPRASRLLFVLPLIALLLSGCNPPPNRGYGGQPNPTPVTGLVSLSPSTTEIITNLALNRSLLRGRTQADVGPPGIEAVPVVADLKPDYEKIASIRPDLILYDSALYNADDVQKLKQLNIPMYAIEATTVVAYIQQLRRLGEILSSETQLNEYADKVESARQAAMADPPSPSPSVAIMMAGEAGQHYICGVDSFQADVVKTAGGTPVGPKGLLFLPANPEGMVQLNPDVILTAGSPDAILADARLKTVKAVASGRVFGISQDVMLRRGARVDQLIEATRSLITRKK